MVQGAGEGLGLGNHFGNLDRREKIRVSMWRLPATGGRMLVAWAMCGVTGKGIKAADGSPPGPERGARTKRRVHGHQEEGKVQSDLAGC